jgi:hypothetical protein
MEQLDERILEVAERECFVSPDSLRREVPNLTASQARLRERCEELRQRGMLAPIVEDTDHYHLTTSGKLYLDGELDAEHAPSHV